MRISDWSSDVCSSDLRGAIIGGAAAGAFAIAGVAWMALGPKTVGIVSGDDGKAITERHTPADEVMNLPGDYRKVTSETPILGAPLPGDLGGPILERQRQLGLRSEEHTSELQSLMRISYAVFCLKKKKSHKTKDIITKEI